jgi:hypothetical protein
MRARRVRVEAAGRPPRCKLIRLSADLEDGVIRDISIRGDFLATPEAGFDRAERRLVGTPAAAAGRNFDLFLKEEGVQAYGINGAAIEELLRHG